MLTLADLSEAVARDLDTLVAIVAVVLIILVLSVTTTIRKTVTTRQREQTKRELAAYVAEGSMNPEDAQKILRSGDSDDVRELVLKRAADGWISAKKANEILKTMNEESPRQA